MKMSDNDYKLINELTNSAVSTAKAIGESLKGIAIALEEAEKKRLSIIMNNTKNKRIKNKLKKRINNFSLLKK